MFSVSALCNSVKLRTYTEGTEVSQRITENKLRYDKETFATVISFTTLAGSAEYHSMAGNYKRIKTMDQVVVAGKHSHRKRYDCGSSEVQ